MTAKLTYTELGELIVFRAAGRIFPTHRKALNALRKNRRPGNEGECISPVRVFPGKMDSEVLAQALRILADCYAAGWQHRLARRVSELGPHLQPAPGLPGLVDAVSA